MSKMAAGSQPGASSKKTGMKPVRRNEGSRVQGSGLEPCGGPYGWNGQGYPTVGTLLADCLD